MNRIQARRFAAVLFAVALSGIPAATATTVHDARGRAVDVKDTSRIVSIGGAVTEILYALGLDKQIVGVDTTSIFPASAMKEKPNVGYMRQLSPEGVLSLNPSVILAVEGSGPKEALSVLQAAQVPFVEVPDQHTADGIIRKINLVAEVAGKPARGECLAKLVKGDLDALAQLRQRIKRPVRVLFLLSFMNDRPMVAGRATAADGIIRLAGAVNAMPDYEGYKLVNEESIITAKPDVVLVMQRASLSLDAKDIFTRPGFQMTPAAAHRAFVSMNGLYLLGFGPRTALAARDLARSLYPELTTEKLPSERGDELFKACQ